MNFIQIQQPRTRTTKTHTQNTNNRHLKELSGYLQSSRSFNNNSTKHPHSRPYRRNKIISKPPEHHLNINIEHSGCVHEQVRNKENRRGSRSGRDNPLARDIRILSLRTQQQDSNQFLSNEEASSRLYTVTENSQEQSYDDYLMNRVLVAKKLHKSYNNNNKGKNGRNEPRNHSDNFVTNLVTERRERRERRASTSRENVLSKNYLKRVTAKYVRSGNHSSRLLGSNKTTREAKGGKKGQNGTNIPSKMLQKIRSRFEPRVAQSGPESEKSKTKTANRLTDNINKLKKNFETVRSTIKAQKQIVQKLNSNRLILNKDRSKSLKLDQSRAKKRARSSRKATKLGNLDNRFLNQRSSSHRTLDQKVDKTHQFASELAEKPYLSSTRDAKGMKKEIYWNQSYKKSTASETQKKRKSPIRNILKKSMLRAKKLDGSKTEFVTDFKFRRTPSCPEHQAENHVNSLVEERRAVSANMFERDGGRIDGYSLKKRKSHTINAFYQHSHHSHNKAHEVLGRDDSGSVSIRNTVSRYNDSTRTRKGLRNRKSLKKSLSLKPCQKPQKWQNSDSQGYNKPIRELREARCSSSKPIRNINSTHKKVQKIQIESLRRDRIYEKHQKFHLKLRSMIKQLCGENLQQNLGSEELGNWRSSGGPRPGIEHLSMTKIKRGDLDHLLSEKNSCHFEKISEIENNFVGGALRRGASSGLSLEQEEASLNHSWAFVKNLVKAYIDARMTCHELRKEIERLKK